MCGAAHAPQGPPCLALIEDDTLDPTTDLAAFAVWEQQEADSWGAPQHAPSPLTPPDTPADSWQVTPGDGVGCEEYYFGEGGRAEYTSGDGVAGDDDVRCGNGIDVGMDEAEEAEEVYCEMEDEGGDWGGTRLPSLPGLEWEDADDQVRTAFDLLQLVLYCFRAMHGL